MNFIVENETTLRLGCYLIGLKLFLIIGFLKPFRKSKKLKSPRRILNNIAIAFTSTLSIRLITTLTLISLSEFAQINSSGLFNFLSLPSFIEVILSILLFDMIIYWQHRISHIVPILWRLHRLHHSDIEFDVTTANRFHPIEIICSLAIKVIFVFLLGISIESIIIFEIILNVSAMFNHGNFTFPKPIDNIIRKFIITPDMHRIHHSVISEETNSNYGFFLSIWDRLFSSYTSEAKNNPQTMDIGLKEFRSEKEQRFIPLLLQPFAKNKSS